MFYKWETEGFISEAQGLGSQLSDRYISTSCCTQRCMGFLVF